MLLILGQFAEIQLHFLLLQSHGLHVGEDKLEVEEFCVIGDGNGGLLVFLIGVVGRETVEDAVYGRQVLVPLGFGRKLQEYLVLSGLELKIGFLFSIISEPLLVLPHMQILENAPHHKLCLVNTAIQVLLLARYDLVEIKGAQPDRQLDGLILIVVHDCVIVALYSGGEQLQKFCSSHDVSETHLDVLEPAQEEVYPQVQEIAKGEEAFV